MIVDRKHLLSSVEMAHFVAHGSLALEGVVPDVLNDRAIAVLETGLPAHPYGTPLDTVFPVGTFVRDLLDLPTVAGAVQSLVGPHPAIDHHAVHVRPPSPCTPTRCSTPGSTPSTCSSCTTPGR